MKLWCYLSSIQPLWLGKRWSSFRISIPRDFWAALWLSTCDHVSTCDLTRKMMDRELQAKILPGSTEITAVQYFSKGSWIFNFRRVKFGLSEDKILPVDESWGGEAKHTCLPLGEGWRVSHSERMLLCCFWFNWQSVTISQIFPTWLISLQVWKGFFWLRSFCLCLPVFQRWGRKGLTLQMLRV